MGDTPFCPHCGAKQERSTKTKKRGNGLGTAYKRKGQKTWTARVTVGFFLGSDGKVKQRYKSKCGFKTQTAALEYCAKLKAEMEAPAKAPQLIHYWELYSHGKMAKLSFSKQDSYKIAWDKIKKLHYMPVDKITVSDIQAIINEKTKTYYPAHDIKVLLSHLYKLICADNFAAKNLADYVDLPKLNEKKGEAFSETEQAALWKAYESGVPYAYIPLIMIYTGIMPGELLSMRVSMVDLKSQKIEGLGMKTEARKKAVVYIPDTILPIMQELCDGKRANDKVIVGNKDTLYKRYYKVIEAAGCRKLPPYSCRHTTATALTITEGIAPQTIQKVMRWSSTRMMDRYVHPSTDDARTAINTLKKPL